MSIPSHIGMKNSNPKIDDYIANAQIFSQPILIQLRNWIHQVCPEVEETIKWGFPHFIYGDGILCSMAAFKQHCVFTFWKAAIMSDPQQLFTKIGITSMGHLGKIKSLADLPAKEILLEYLQEALRLNQEGVKLPTRKTTRNQELNVPEYLMVALQENVRALKVFNNFSYTNKKEYIDWLTEAKTEATRQKRLGQAIDWIAAGKTRNWRYTARTKVLIRPIRV